MIIPRSTQPSRLGSDPLAYAPLSFIRDTREEEAENEQESEKQSKHETPLNAGGEEKRSSKQRKQKTSNGQGKNLSKSEPDKGNGGRPRGPAREIVTTSQAGLPVGWTRATFILREDLLTRAKDYAYWERLEIKQVVNAAIENYLKGKQIRPRP